MYINSIKENTENPITRQTQLSKNAQLQSSDNTKNLINDIASELNTITLDNFIQLDTDDNEMDSIITNNTQEDNQQNPSHQKDKRVEDVEDTTDILNKIVRNKKYIIGGSLIGIPALIFLAHYFGIQSNIAAYFSAQPQITVSE